HSGEFMTHVRFAVRVVIGGTDSGRNGCSGTFGAQVPAVAKVSPSVLLRSSFYAKLMGIDRTYAVEHRYIYERTGEPQRERVGLDVEVTVDHIAEWLDWFFNACDIQPVWLCSIKLNSKSTELIGTGEKTKDATVPWPLYPLDPETTWINFGFWSAVPGDHVSADAK